VEARTGAGSGFRSVVFDCDSTLVSVEGIDELAGAARAEVQALTDAAMEGTVPLEEVYGRRLALIRPSRARVEALGDAYVRALVPGARETVAALLAAGREVRVVSGGVTPAVEAVSAALGLAPERVAAVGIHFAEDGAYAGFDEASPLARSDGKAEVIRAWSFPRPILLVGDGATDLAARPAVDAFAAYTAVAHRPAVAAAADFVLPGLDLRAVLDIVCTAEERARFG
jgi:phosphoserine phosphatase